MLPSAGACNELFSEDYPKCYIPLWERSSAASTPIFFTSNNHNQATVEWHRQTQSEVTDNCGPLDETYPVVFFQQEGFDIDKFKLGASS